LASNIRVTNVSLDISPKQPSGTIGVKFDVNWDGPYSGTDSNGNAFFDRAWIFVKFWDKNWPTNGSVGWKHADLVKGGTLSAYDHTPNTGLSADGKGAFCSPGTNQVVYWNYKADGVLNTDNIKVQVFAIEMVYIPQGSFYVGDGTAINITGQLCTTNFHTNPFQISGEEGLLLGGGSLESLGDNNGVGMLFGVDDFNDSTSRILPVDFPKGYNAFYIMKYEISQGQYRDFLNTLTRAQQNNRTASPSLGHYVMSNTTTVSCRNSIRAQVSNPASHPSGPITFGCDLNENRIFNEADDGEWIACNYLSWMDLAAYAAWAGLRPMTELEFEKAARGPDAPINNEYAWGGTDITPAQTNIIINSGQNNERVGQTGEGLCRVEEVEFGGIPGPLRSGFSADLASTRINAGSSYYGVMDLSGNLWKRVVTIGDPAGRRFSGSNGTGTLATDGNATNSDWPGYSSGEVSGATGSGFRGGSWLDGATYTRISDRTYAAVGITNRFSSYGGRCVRTSP
jgi:formylglycine-generating enzyme required for sulfatase activity